MKRALVVALALAGCSTPTAQLKKQLGPRAASYLECEEPQLTYQELDRLISTTKVKVKGCGREATYTLVESRWQLSAAEADPEN